MAVRELIVSGFSGPDAVKNTDEFFRVLIGQFVDELSEPHRLLYEYAMADGRPDLWLVGWDEEEHKLYLPGSTGPDGNVEVKFRFRPRTEVLVEAAHAMNEVTNG